MRKPDRMPRQFTRYVLLVVLVFAAVVSIAVASLLIANPAKDASFRADVTLQNVPSSFDPGGLPRVDEFAAVASSPDALKQTSDTLAKQGLRVGAGELSDALTATVEPNGKTIDFTVKRVDGDASLAVARAWSDVSLRLMTEQAPALELEAAAPQRAELEQAKAELEKRRVAVSDLGGPVLVGQAAGGRIGLIATEYQARLIAIAAKGVEQMDLRIAVDSLQAAVRDGAALSSSQLRVIVAGALPADALPSGSLSPEEAVTALEIRLKVLDGSVAGMEQEARFLRRALDKTSADLEQATVDLEAAEESYKAAEAALYSFQVAASSIRAEAKLSEAPHLNRGGASEWAIRLGAAVVIATVVSLLGILILRRSRRRASETAAPAGRGFAYPRTQPLTAGGWRSQEAAARESRKKMRQRAEAIVAAVIAVLLAGLLGTFALRLRSRGRARLGRRR